MQGFNLSIPSLVLLSSPPSPPLSISALAQW